MNRPSISQIYSAFNPASHHVFRRAMRNSSGGVLRVEDLVRAILELDLPAAHPELTSPSNALQTLTPTRPAALEQSQLVPMSNDPALQEVLERAWYIAIAQIAQSMDEDDDASASQSGTNSSLQQQRVSLTPACLTAAVLIQRGCLSTGPRREAAFSELGLIIPTSLLPRDSCNERSSHANETQGLMVERTNSPGPDTPTSLDKYNLNEAESIDDALELWLHLQSIRDPRERQQVKATLSQLIVKIERTP